MGDFSGKVAIVTGAASGVGRGLCEVLLDQGAIVHATDIRIDALAGLASGAGELSTAQLDVTRALDVAELVRRVANERGRLDLIFNNAGIGVVGDFRRIDLDDVRRSTDVNLWGVVYGTKAAYEVMAEQGHGHIVNIASSAGVMPVPMQTSYAMTKHAVVGFSRSLRIEAATYGVKVSAVLPGLVRTGFFEAATVVGDYDYQQEMEDVPVRPMAARRAGELILAGVRANRELIAFPTSNRLILWLFRHFPALMMPALARTTTKSLTE
ncbi:MAG: SDR family oxidoreductase [Myxococcales bacterium]|nr:MAG: SDR family oxidoreductase [Myxococcales bacterium]